MSDVPESQAPDKPITETPPETGGEGQQPTTAEAKFTQADLDRIVKERIERERAKAEEREKKAREEAERKAAEEQGKFKELYEATKAQAEEAERQRKALELQVLRQKVAQEVGIPAPLADRLRGETQEELEADAKQLLETLPKVEPQAPSLNGGAGRGSRPGENVILTDAQLAVAKKMNISPEQYKAQLVKK